MTGSAHPTRGPQPPSPAPSRRWMPYLAPVLILVATGLVARYVAMVARNRDELRFQVAVEQADRSVESRLQAYLALLRAGTALFSASDEVTWQDFHRFAEGLRLRDQYPGLLGIGYAVRLRGTGADSLQATLRRQWSPGYRIWPGLPGAAASAIAFLEPIDARNREAMGFDMASNPIRAAAMARARDLGDAVLSGKVELVQEIFPDKQPGFLIYSPVYRTVAVPATVGARREQLVGWVYSPLRAGDFLSGALAADSLRQYTLLVYDGPRPDSATLLYRSRRAGTPVSSRAHRLVRTVYLAHRPWTLVFLDRDGGTAGWLVPLVLIGGGGIALLLILLFRAQLRGRAEAERSAADLRRSARALTESEQRFRQLIEQSPLSIQVFDAGGRTIQVNRAFRDLWGVGLEDLRAEAFSLLDDPQLAQAGLTPLIRGAFEGRPATLPALGYTPAFGPRAGEEIWVAAHVYPVRDPEGRVREVVLVHENITERRRAERRLQFQLDLMNTITSNAVDALFLLDRDGRVTFLNPAAERIFGWRRDELLGRRLHDVIHHHDVEGEPLPAEQCALVRVLWSGRPLQNHDDVFLHRDGHQVPVSCSSAPIHREGQITSAVLVVHDVTERRRAEAALRESEERLRAIFSQVNVGIAQTRLDGRFVLVNQRYCEMLGYSRSELLWMSIADVTHPDDRAHTRELYRELLRTGGSFSQEKRYVRKDGEAVWVSKSVSVVRDAAGVPTSAVLIAEDITDRKRTEEALRHTQKLESIGLLAGGIAHDFNNLLTGILGNASLALRALPPGSGERTLLEDVIRASERAADLTRQLLAYAGKGRFYLQAVRMGQLVRELTGLLRTSIPRKVELELALADDLPLVEGDPGQLQQLMMNLVINGAEAIGDRAGTVRVEARAVSLGAVALAREYPAYQLTPGSYVEIRVEDTGCGMSPETLSQMFDPFFTTKFTGRGLGLAAVLGIVRGHRGGIAVSSTPGQGTRFTVVLPSAGRATPEPAPTALPPAEPEPARPAGTILVVEDEPMLRGLARSVLESEGYRVVTAEDGRQALELAGRHRDSLALVVLDLLMPVMGGAEAGAKFATEFPGTPLVVTSGMGETALRDQFGKQGAVRFLQKPYTPEALASAVRDALE